MTGIHGDPWRLRCPHGHATPIRRRDGVSKCQTCGTRWRGEPLDAKRVDQFPVDVDEHAIEVIERANRS